MYAICSTQVSSGCIICSNAESIRSDYFAKNTQHIDSGREQKSIIFPIPPHISQWHDAEVQIENRASNSHRYKTSQREKLARPRTWLALSCRGKCKASLSHSAPTPRISISKEQPRETRAILFLQASLSFRRFIPALPPFVYPARLWQINDGALGLCLFAFFSSGCSALAIFYLLHARAFWSMRCDRL
jgi:hypothetical protein